MPEILVSRQNITDLTVSVFKSEPSTSFAQQQPAVSSQASPVPSTSGVGQEPNGAIPDVSQSSASSSSSQPVTSTAGAIADLSAGQKAANFAKQSLSTPANIKQENAIMTSSTPPLSSLSSPQPCTSLPPSTSSSAGLTMTNSSGGSTTPSNASLPLRAQMRQDILQHHHHHHNAGGPPNKRMLNGDAYGECNIKFSLGTTGRDFLLGRHISPKVVKHLFGVFSCF